MIKNTKRIILLAKHRLVSGMLASLLESQKELRVTASVKTGPELMKSEELAQANLILIDLEALGGTGFAALEKLINQFPNSAVLIYSALSDSQTLKRCLGLGARGYILKSDSQEILLSAVQNVLSDKMAISPAINPCLKDDIKLLEYRNLVHELTPREIEVMSLVATGLSSRKIAESLTLSRRTVDKHRENIKLKLNGKSPHEVEFVIRNYGLL